MYFEPGHIYHIFNQGNNRQTVFFNREHYLFFLKKINLYIAPYAEILAWCLMPNHFHLMVLVKDTNTSQGFTLSETLTKGSRSEALASKSLNHAIGVMLRSYTRAINKEQQRTGSLFRKETKAECITKIEGITPSFYNTAYGTIINIRNPEKEYPKACFDYIHNNPLQAGLVNEAADWEFSSLRDYIGLREGKLINRIVAKEWGLISEGDNSERGKASEGFTLSETLT